MDATALVSRGNSRTHNPGLVLCDPRLCVGPLDHQLGAIVLKLLLALVVGLELCYSMRMRSWWRSGEVG